MRLFTETISAVIAIINGFHAPIHSSQKEKTQLNTSCVSMNKNAGDRLQGLLFVSFQTAVGSTSLPWY